MKKCLLLTLVFLLAIPAAVFAQSATTGALSGTVLDADGRALPGVTVKALHNPTGTEFVAVTREDGKFLMPAVKVGGPYVITAMLDGFRTEKKENVVIKLSEKKQLNFVLNLATIDAGQIVVTASTPVINPSRTGAAQNVSNETIENLPSISRSISDFTRLAPQFASGEESGSFSAGGRSTRYNNIQIDGAQNNDLFGLGDSGTPGGQTATTPISLDAIQEFQIVMAPYDVRHGGFTGGGVNVITKSGTNKFHGSAYYFGRNQDLVGKGPSDYDFAEFSEKIGGFTLGGPIIKNKLFFFISGEMSKEKKPEDYYIDGSGAANDWGNKEDADRFISILKGYGYDAGSYDEVSNEIKSDKLFVRLDWNINTNHRLTVRHNYVNAKRDILRRNSKYSFTFGNGGYLMKSKSNSTVIQLNSTLSQSLFNELRINYTTIRDKRTGMGEDFPNVYVKDPGFGAGTEQYSTRNSLDQDVLELSDTLTIFSGNHTFIIGTHNEFFKFDNVFLKKAFGSYTFDNLDDFEKGLASKYEKVWSITDDPNAAAKFNASQLGFFVGDEWQVTKNLTLNYGVRMDVPLFPDDPPANPDVEAAFGIKTNQTPNGKILWSPRLGFNWDVSGNKETQVRGGIGIFSGRTPYVWLSNQYSNTGMTQREYKGYGDFDFVADPLNQPDVTGNRTATINLIDKDYKFPQVLRTNIAIDQELPLGFIGTVEFIYTKDINAIMYKNINLAPTGETQADGRAMYGTHTYGSRFAPTFVNEDFNDVVLLENTSKGYNYTLSFQLQKNWGRGNMVNASYTYGMSKDLFSGTSSQALSNWKYNVTSGDPNKPELTYSSHDTRHRIVLSASKRFEFFKNAPTTISVFYQGRSGRPYSTRYRYDYNGDGYSNDSIYVPKDENDIILVKGTWADLDKYISSDPALDKHRGQIMPRNASRDPWNHRVDLKFTQDLPVPGMKGHKLQLIFNIENLLNLFDKDSGVLRYVQYDDAPLEFAGYDKETGKPTFKFNGNATEKDARYTINQILSRWRAQLGIRYKF